MTSEIILNNLNNILSRIKKACELSGREESEVKLLLATKTQPAEVIKIAIDAGQSLIAENKVQELKEKYEALKPVPHTNHFIGHLQTNKIKEILRYEVACVQSVDRWDLAEKLHQKLLQEQRTMDILIQVNTSKEESKYGVSPENTLELVRNIAQLSTLNIKGLMTIGILSENEDEVRQCFRQLRQLSEAITAENLPNVQMQELSMGMSGDLELAIQEGATIIRVGSAIFGERVYH